MNKHIQKKRLKLFAIPGIIIVVLFSLFLLNNHFKLLNNLMSIKITKVSNLNLTNFSGQIFMNGTKVDNSNNLVMKYNGEVYLSYPLLNKYFGVKLSDDSGLYKFKIRFVEKNLDEIVKYNDNYYFTLAMLGNYINYNKHILTNSNELYAYNVLPNNIFYNDREYERKNNSIDLKNASVKFVGISTDGYGIYVADNSSSIWIAGEKDSSTLIEYFDKSEMYDLK